jgi:hypothetical protein
MNSMAAAAGSAAANGAQNAKPLLAAGPPDIGSREMFSLIRELVRPYTGWLVVVLIAMLIETAMSLASPWPLKVVIDSVLGSHPLPEWLRVLRPAYSHLRSSATHVVVLLRQATDRNHVVHHHE